MPSAQQRQRIVLAALLVVLVVVLVWRRDEAPTEGPPATRPSAPATGARRGGGPADLVADVRLESLAGGDGAAGQVRRNLFRFREAPPPAARGTGGRGRGPVVEFGTPQVPQGPPPIPLRLIGMLVAPTQAGRVAILSDGRGNVFNGREDDVIEGRYRVLRVGVDSIEMAYTDGRGRQVIRLSGQ